MEKPFLCATSYDRVAAEYTSRIADELNDKPLDRAMLRAFAEQAGSIGPLADLGCGPGHVAAFLASMGATIQGFDLSGEMIVQARKRYPALDFQQGDLRALPVPDATFAGLTSFYSIIHLVPEELVPTFREWRRVLRPTGHVLIAFHIGDSVTHLDDWWGQPVDLDFRFFQPDTIIHALQQAQFTIEATLQRAPYPNVEHPSKRAYVFARKTE